MKDFKNKVVVVTGAGSGMGRAYAVEFAKLGAKLGLNDFNAETLAETVKLLEGSNAAAVYSEAFDVSDQAAMDSFAESIKSTLGHAHVMINNAGIEGSQKSSWELTQAEHEKIFGINYYGVVNGTRAFMPQLLANNEGAMVNVSSIFGLVGIPGASDYCATKFAVRGFTESLMVELHESPVNAYLVHPGGIATNIAQSEGAKDFSAKFLITPPEDIVKYVIESIGKGRLRIVYGQNAFSTWMGALFVPLKTLNGIIWKQMKAVMDSSNFPSTK
jgi:short-subunit dehydrogenase